MKSKQHPDAKELVILLFDPIESSRLLLRPFKTADCESVLEYQSNPQVVRHVPWIVRDASMVEEALAKAINQTKLLRQGDYLSLALVRKSDGRLVGQMNAMFVSEKDQCGEIGYVVNPIFSRQGFATEASRALVTAMFDSKQFRRVIARFDDRNLASRGVVEKLGFREEAHFIMDGFFKGEWISTFIYATLRDEWTKSQHSRTRTNSIAQMHASKFLPSFVPDSPRSELPRQGR
jgi:RimJ/RimL family protein N-acetyltransferase